MGSVSGSRVGVAVVAGSGGRGGGRRSRWYMSVLYEGLDGTDEGLDWTEEGRARTVETGLPDERLDGTFKGLD